MSAFLSINDVKICVTVPLELKVLHSSKLYVTKPFHVKRCNIYSCSSLLTKVLLGSFSSTPIWVTLMTKSYFFPQLQDSWSDPKHGLLSVRSFCDCTCDILSGCLIYDHASR